MHSCYTDKDEKMNTVMAQKFPIMECKKTNIIVTFTFIHSCLTLFRFFTLFQVLKLGHRHFQ